MYNVVISSSHVLQKVQVSIFHLGTPFSWLPNNLFFLKYSLKECGFCTWSRVISFFTPELVAYLGWCSGMLAGQDQRWFGSHGCGLGEVNDLTQKAWHCPSVLPPALLTAPSPGPCYMLVTLLTTALICQLAHYSIWWVEDSLWEHLRPM